MGDDHHKRSGSLQEIYALIDRSRLDAAKAAEAKFHTEIEAAISAIASISSIAGARVLADSRVASANVLINAELAATRLLADAEMQASRAASEILTKPKEAVQASLREIGRQTSLHLATSAQQSVEKIQQDAEAAIQLLRETSAIAIREIQTLAITVVEQTKHDAASAAQKLKEYRRTAHSMSDATSEGEDAADIVIKAAEDASIQLQSTMKNTLAQITRIADEACSLVREAALVAERKIKEGLEKALLRLKDALKPYASP
jgi:uncharacterized protein YijF (DUF1287 family)